MIPKTLMMLKKRNHKDDCFIKRVVQNKKDNKSENCLAPNSAQAVVILLVKMLKTLRTSQVLKMSKMKEIYTNLQDCVLS